MTSTFALRSCPPSVLACIAATVLMTGCATQAPTRTDFIATGVPMERVEDTMRAQIERRRDPAAADPLRTVSLLPTALSTNATLPDGIARDAIRTVLSEVDRQLCYAASDRFTLVAADARQPDTAVIQAQITRIQRTDPSASVASAVVSRVIPGPGSVRLPLGRGGVAIEATATLGDGREAAAMSWSRGAGVAFDRGSLSEVGDAHRYAGSFADDFTQWLAGPRPQAQSKPASDPCAQFGPRIDVGQQAARFGLGLHTLGATVPEAKAPQSEVSAPLAAPPPSR
jgi:Protein of unknown function (DUF3313)